MKYKRRSFLRLTLFSSGALVLGACMKKPGSTSSPSSDVDYYTCTMHPFVHSLVPGKCPVCSMDLVPVMKKGAAAADATKGATANEFVVPVERQQQIGVTYATVERKPLHRTIRGLGMVQPDSQRTWQFVARVDGYVEKLYVASAGQAVEKDTPIMSIYSPDLLTSEQELAQLLKARDDAPTREARETTARLIEAAENRLRHWNVTDAQIADLEKARKPDEYLTLLSPFRGVVKSMPVTQGRNVKTGDVLAEVADLSVVWVWAEFYENEVSMLRQGQKIVVTVKSYPGVKFDGEIALVNPFVDETRRTSKVRIDIPNPDFKLQPGMYGNVELGVDMGVGLVVPVSAIMPTGERSIVFVDKGGGKLEPRVVQPGGKFGEFYEIKEGLDEGERVVASANFLIDAESKVQGALKDFEATGTISPEVKQ